MNALLILESNCDWFVTITAVISASPLILLSATGVTSNQISSFKSSVKCYLNPYIDLFNSEVISYHISKQPSYQSIDIA
ncbi:hypothetical protein, partial [Lactococcus lactis]|uniref:hypothetical protein n=1 Tax=Lactococcus lactis TaxID=1358 RepID=UPI0021A70B6A